MHINIFPRINNSTANFSFREKNVLAVIVYSVVSKDFLLRAIYKYLGLCSHKVPVATTQLHPCSTETAMNNQSIRTAVFQ